MNGVGEIVIGGVGTGVIITFLVQLAKRVGLPDGYAGYLAAGLSVVAYVLYQVTQLFPQSTSAIVAVLTVLSFIAMTFGSALVAYLGLRKAQIFKT